MQTVPETRTPNKAFYATVYDLPARLVKVDGIIYVVTDDDVQPFEVEMAPFTCVLGELGVADPQRLMDVVVHGGYAAVACSREEGVN